MTNEITVAELNKIIEVIKRNSSYDGEVLYLGNLLEIKPVYSRTATGEAIEGYDIYQYADRELMEDEDYDFDADFICTVYVNE